MSPSVNSLIIDQLRTYYPKRVSDYINHRLIVEVYIVRNENDQNYLRELRQSVSIDDPACCLIVGFSKATLFLAPPLFD